MVYRHTARVGSPSHEALWLIERRFAQAAGVRLVICKKSPDEAAGVRAVGRVKQLENPFAPAANPRALDMANSSWCTLVCGLCVASAPGNHRRQCWRTGFRYDLVFILCAFIPYVGYCARPKQIQASPRDSGEMCAALYNSCWFDFRVTAYSIASLLRPYKCLCAYLYLYCT